MNILFNYKHQNDRYLAKDQFNSIIKTFHFWKPLLKIKDLLEREEEIDLILSNADYSKDLSVLFKEKKHITTITNNIKEIEFLISDNLAILDDIEDDDFYSFFENNLVDIYYKMDVVYKNALNQNEYAKNHCYINFKASTGGKESENLNYIMFKNYLKMLDEYKYNFELIDYDETGNQLLKHATIRVDHKYAFGIFKTEKGIHRFTRVSPYGNGKLHTSFVFLDVYPHIEFEKQVNINKSDLRIDTFRGSGAGGQHKNVTDSAVRITHIPTGIVVKIENERSQHQNKKEALDILASKLYELETSLYEKESNDKKGKNNTQDWGQQIRSYSIEQNRIKDHRTNLELNCNINNYFQNVYDFIIKNNIEISIK